MITRRVSHVDGAAGPMLGWSVLLRAFLALGILTLAVGTQPALGQRDTAEAVDPQGRGTPPASRWGLNIDPSRPLQPQYGQLRDYAQRLDALGYFASAVIGTWDKQWLDEPKEQGHKGPPNFNCLGTIWPEANAHENPGEDLLQMPDAGRITAKILIEGDHCPFYEQGDVRLWPGVSYVWIDSFSVVSEDEAVARVAIIHETRQLQETTIKICWHPGYTYAHAHARWRHDPDDAKAWWTCVKKGCCNLP